MSQLYVLDTSVISLLAPGRTELADDAARWFEERGADLRISAVTVTEIEQGVRKLIRSGAVQRAQRYSAWLDDLTETHAGRVLPFDTLSARLAGVLSDRALASGRHPGFADVAIAATALANQAVLLTRNLRHFEPLGVIAIDPVGQLPD